MIDPRQLCQIEIRISDLERSLAFYRQVFGWKPVPAEVHNYIILDVPEDCPVGITLIPGNESKEDSKRLVLYFAVDDPEEIISKVKDLGGRVILGPRKVQGYGTIYQFTDPNGQCFGLFKKSANAAPVRT